MGITKVVYKDYTKLDAFGDQVLSATACLSNPNTGENLCYNPGHSQSTAWRQQMLVRMSYESEEFVVREERRSEEHEAPRVVRLEGDIHTRDGVLETGVVFLIPGDVEEVRLAGRGVSQSGDWELQEEKDGKPTGRAWRLQVS